MRKTLSRLMAEGGQPSTQLHSPPGEASLSPCPAPGTVATRYKTACLPAPRWWLECTRRRPLQTPRRPHHQRRHSTRTRSTCPHRQPPTGTRSSRAVLGLDSVCVHKVASCSRTAQPPEVRHAPWHVQMPFGVKGQADSPAYPVHRRYDALRTEHG